jgi:hypothetical protein
MGMHPFLPILLAVASPASTPAEPSPAETATLQADPGVPAGAAEAAERLVRMINEKKTATPEGRQLLVGELGRLTDLPFGLPRPDRLLPTPAGAVARLPATDRSGTDIYVYLRRAPTGWEAHALRTLALTGIASELSTELRAKSTRTPEDEAELRNVELLLSSDRNLSEWFAAHRERLDRARTDPDDERLEEELTALGLAAFRQDQGMFVASIGGMLDNEVGFLFAEAAPPPIDPGRYIWLEPLGGGWYLFKTT